MTLSRAVGRGLAAVGLAVVLPLGAQDAGTQDASAPDIAPAACAEPVLKAEVTTIDEVNALTRAADAYRSCLMDYAARHKAIADRHGEAANEAMRRWNAFAEKHSAPAPAGDAGPAPGALRRPAATGAGS